MQNVLDQTMASGMSSKVPIVNPMTAVNVWIESRARYSKTCFAVIDGYTLMDNLRYFTYMFIMQNLYPRACALCQADLSPTSIILKSVLVHLFGI